ncbi:hypothetical protein [Halococcus agarilyticus]|uniref:hypothetical protein n=1 Tax=Halococcus agarilyticus TaxID=1232219 RepID=UPI00067818EB|nr:hypothetical protein [Halococcus agarilyticus]
MRETGAAMLIAGFVMLAAVGFGGGFAYAQLSDTETAEVSVSAGTWSTTAAGTAMPTETDTTVSGVTTTGSTEVSEPTTDTPDTTEMPTETVPKVDEPTTAATTSAGATRTTGTETTDDTTTE